MKNLLVLCISFVLYINASNAQEIINVWQNSNPPTSYNTYDNAQLTVYIPKIKNDSVRFPVVLICPGGGYAGVSMPNEGHAFAKWLQSQGFVAVILKYRLPEMHKEIPFDDAIESINIIKSNAQAWNIDLDKFGIAGFSAGGHLAAVLSNKLVNETEAIHPVFNILFYPVISLEQVTKGKTRDNLLGKDPSAEDIRNYSAQYLVTQRTPNTIIFASDNDDSVPSMQSITYYSALKDNDVTGAMYIFPSGGHGWAMLDDFEYNKLALSLLSKWLEQYK